MLSTKTACDKLLNMEKNKVCVRAAADYNTSTVDAAVRSMIDSLGGIAKFVKPGQTVVLKPNLVIAAEPKKATTTHPAVVAAVARLCYEAKAARIIIADSPGGPFSSAWLSGIYRKTGMTELVENLRAEFAKNVEVCRNKGNKDEDCKKTGNKGEDCRNNGEIDGNWRKTEEIDEENRNNRQIAENCRNSTEIAEKHRDNKENVEECRKNGKTDESGTMESAGLKTPNGKNQDCKNKSLLSNHNCIIELNSDFTETIVDYPDGVMAKKIPVCSVLDNADVIINIAKMKTHAFAGISGACKNMYGAIPGLKKVEWHQYFQDIKAFSNCLLDIQGYFAPKLKLHIIDAIDAMEGPGPTSGTPIHVGLLLAGTCFTSLDIACIRIMGDDPALMPTITAAAERGFFKNTADRNSIRTDKNEPEQDTKTDGNTHQKDIKTDENTPENTRISAEKGVKTGEKPPKTDENPAKKGTKTSIFIPKTGENRPENAENPPQTGDISNIKNTDFSFEIEVDGSPLEPYINQKYKRIAPSTYSPTGKSRFTQWIIKKIFSQRPAVSRRKCRGCLKCKEHCPVSAINESPKRNGQYVTFDTKKCIRCFCCQELCPFHLIKVKTPLLVKIMNRSKAKRAKRKARREKKILSKS